MKRVSKIFISLFLIFYSLTSFGQRALTIGLQAGPNWGFCYPYITKYGNLLPEDGNLFMTPKIGFFVDVAAKGNFHLQIGIDIASQKTQIQGVRMGTIISTYIDGKFQRVEDVEYDYEATEVLHLKYLRFPVYATYHLKFNSRFKLIYGLGAAYGHLLKMENKVVAGPQLISNRRFTDHDLVLSVFHAAEITFCKQWGIRLGLYFDQGVVNIDDGTKEENVYNAKIPKVYSQYFGANIGLTYNLSKLKAE